MPFPSYVPVRTVTVGGAMVIESAQLLKVQVTITASRSLVWDATGYRFERMGVTASSELGSEVAIVLPRTDVQGWKDAATGQIIDVSAEDSFTHRYVAQVRFTDDAGRSIPIAPVTIGPFVLPEDDGSPIDLDKMVPASTVAGESINIPDWWSVQIAAAEQYAQQAADALVDSAEFVGDELVRPGAPAQMNLAGVIAIERSRADSSYARGLNVTSLSALRRWEVALADADNANAVITVMGDSITWGTGADGYPDSSGPDQWSQLRQYAWAVQLRRLFARRYGVPVAENFIGLTSGWGYANIVGASSSPSIGPFGGYSTGGAGGRTITGAAQTVTVPASNSGTFTELDVWIWGLDSGVSGPRVPSVTVDGDLKIAAAATPPTGFHRQIVTGLTDSTHEVVLAGFGVDAGTAFVSHMVTRYPTGIVVNRIGRPGATMQDASGGTQSAVARARAIRASVMPGFTNLLVISLGTNDHTAQVSIEDYKTRMQEVITEAVNGGACVLLLGEPPAANGSSTAITEDQYRDAMRELALTNQHVAYTDTRDLFGSRTSAWPEGLFPTVSTVHPSRRGHGLMARGLFELLTQARMS